MTLMPWLRAHPTAFWRYGSCPEMYGSPGPTSKAQYPMGMRTWFSLQRCEVGERDADTDTDQAQNGHMHITAT